MVSMSRASIGIQKLSQIASNPARQSNVDALPRHAPIPHPEERRLRRVSKDERRLRPSFETPLRGSSG
jgi:hypothetical protein